MNHQFADHPIFPTFTHRDAFAISIRGRRRITIMAFMLRRPFAVTSAFKQAPQISNTAIRSFHHGPVKQNAFKGFFKPATGNTLKSSFASSKKTFQQTFRREYQQQSSFPNPVAQGGNLTQRLIYGGAIFGGTLVAINLIFNRETREDGGMPPFEQSYLNQTFLHTGLGVGIIAIAARAMHMNGWSYRLMAANPWLVLGIGLVGSIGTMYGTMACPPDK